MSYADLVREELAALPIKRPCCRREWLNGLFLRATEDGDSLTVSFSSPTVASAVAEQLGRQAGRGSEITVTETVKNGRALHQVTCRSQTVWKQWERFRSATNRLTEEGVDADAVTSEIVSFACEGCRGAFLRGAFLVCATVSDPHRSIHLEFTPKGEGAVALLSHLLVALGYPPREAKRNAGVGLYFKDMPSVEDLVAITGAGRMAMDIMNVRIERDIRNQENRATNCVAKNIEKSVSACARQMAAIEKLTLNGMLAQLPESLRITARLRAENPDASLEELRNLHTPPITKSGLNHRLQRLLQEAEKPDAL